MCEKFPTFLLYICGTHIHHCVYDTYGGWRQVIYVDKLTALTEKK